ncbi:BgTH12-04937 [Blumeria graminis f. sp. triticale]|uniref:BgTH12-04937 n=1 Tax=Blumeria graminis f. sp. triticale TaxID=1689686 RepID=A0A9W4GE94_BLUGR|nr:BgTH12-04937 [Blumeria graminis f. sp. triticale]
MPSYIPKKTRFAPGTKRHGPDEVLDVAYLQELLGAVRTGIQDEKRRVRGLSAHNSKLQKRLEDLRQKEEELIAMTKDLQREVRKEKLRTERLRHQSQSARASRLMVQNCNGYPPLPDNHWNPYFVDPREFMSQFPSNPPISHGPIYHQVQPSQPPPPPNYFHNPHLS